MKINKPYTIEARYIGDSPIFKKVYSEWTRFGAYKTEAASIEAMRQFQAKEKYFFFQFQFRYFIPLNEANNE